FEVRRLRLAEHVAKLALREERAELVRERRERLLALASRELVPLAPELRECDRIPDDITAPLRRIGQEFEHLGERGCRFACATAGEERCERRAEDVFRARTPKPGEEPAEDPGQRLDLQIRFLGPTREQVERWRIGLVAEVEENDVVDPRAGDPL